ncbi:alpha-2-macroglobulin family protein [Haloferula chungangensis]|uniref:Alpha-2-macroglobulin family protein n=1 Tax=Haloferula chungangensis TaxID=1048331 RepID=A0ABW2L099_9BACT
MKAFLVIFSLWTCLLTAMADDSPSEAAWRKVWDAREKDQPKTEIELLKEIEKLALTAEDWDEAARAMAQRIATEGQIEGEATVIKKLDAELETAPESMKPILRALAAGWMHGYYLRNQWKFMQRSSTGEPAGDDLETWDLARILLDIDQRMQLALDDEEALKRVPVTDFSMLTKKGELGDEWRPTMFDFVAQRALEFYQSEEVAVSRPVDAFEIAVDSPVFGPVDEFLAWKPETEDATSPKLRALVIHQKLLKFHQKDEQQDAYLLADLERLRWAELVSVGDAKEKRSEKALEEFIERNAGNPISAWAREDLGKMLEAQERTKEAHAVFQAGADAYPDHDFGKLCQNGVNRLERRDLNLSTESQWTPAGEEIRVTYRNLNRVWFRVYSMSFKPGKATLTSDPLPDQEQWLPAMMKGDPLKAWDRELVDESDFSQRSAWLETPKDLPNGYHVLVASADEDFSLSNNSLDVVGIHVTPLAMIVSARNDGVLDGHVVDAVSGAPLAGVEVGAWVQWTTLIRSQQTTTDESGYFRFKKQHDGHHLVVASRERERAVARIYVGSRRLQKERDSEMVVFFTDRAIYRPGQTVHFKGIFTVKNQEGSKYEVIAGKRGAVVFLDPNRKELSRVDVMSNERGSFSGTFTAPEGSVLGQCMINVPGVSGGAVIRVEEYKRPKFFTEIDAPKEAAALGEQVKVKVRAEAYTGAAVDGAKVSWRVTRTSRLPVWARWCWWVPPMSSNAEEIAHGVSETGADGSVEIVFKAKPDKSVKEDVEPVFDFEIVADVTDGAGETRSSTRRVSVAYTSLKASMSAEEWLESGKKLEVKLRTESHDGEGRSAKGVVKIHRLKEPEICPRPESGGGGYPQLEEGDERPSVDPDRWEPGEVVEELAVETDDKGEALIEPVLDAGAYRLVFESKDSNGRKVQALLGIEVVSPDADDFPTMMPFFTGSPNWKVEPGSSVSLLWGSGHDEARACVEWYQDQKLLKREWSAEGRTQQVFSYPIEEKQRGGITVVVRQVAMNRLHQFQRQVEVPWTNKELKLRWEHLVSKLEPGARETWTAVIEGADGEAAVAEMVATMYDASLDAYAPHGFQTLAGILRREGGYYGGWRFSSGMSHFQQRARFDSISMHGVGPLFRMYPGELEVYSGGVMSVYGGGWGDGGGGFGRRFSRVKGAVDSFEGMALDEVPRATMAMEAAGGLRSGDGAITRNSIDAILNNPGRVDAEAKEDVDQVVARKNLQETAFFYPDLTSDEDGMIRMTFTMPEALTKWRFMGMAHDADFRSGLLEGETVTSKDLMVQPNPPRFLREGDVLEFTVKVTNQSEKEQTGTARLTLADAATDEDRTAALGVAVPDQAFAVPAKESRTLKWKLSVPDGAAFLKYKAVASSGNLSDGEEGWLPVISKRILVTESMSLPIRNAGTKEFEFTKLLESGNSETLENRFLHVQVVSQPAWYAVMALPYLMEFPHECSEQTFNRYYANALARHIAKSDPKMRRIFDQWKADGKALDSPLMKNADLKGILLEETPWLREATNESEARRRVGMLFDENHMNRELEKALRKLNEMQLGDGLWPWFPGGRGSEYISLYVTTGFARLRALGVETDITPALRALGPLDARLTEYYEDIAEKDRGQNHLSPWVAHHLYTRTFFLKDKALNQRDKVAFDYFADQAREYWVSLASRMSRAHAALALHRLGDKEVPQLVTRSLKEHAKITEEQGMFWKDGEGEGWWWWQAPIETQAMMIEAFREIDADDKAVDDCQVWLIKQKQVADWKTTKATADAVYSLLMGGRNLLGSDALLKISLGGEEVKPEMIEAGTGFYESRLVEEAVKPELGKIELEKSDDGVSWASVHWQHLEDMSKVTSDEGNQLKLEKSLFIRKNSDKGPVLMPLDGPVQVGDELVTRVILKNDRAMEFIHLKDLRGSGTEPLNVLSGYRWQDGFGYYEVTRDTASHFFIDRLPPGTHVFETSVRVQHAGDYQTGIAEVRCMYAPEFAAHSGSLEIKAE